MTSNQSVLLSILQLYRYMQHNEDKDTTCYTSQHELIQVTKSVPAKGSFSRAMPDFGSQGCAKKKENSKLKLMA